MIECPLCGGAEWRVVSPFCKTWSRSAVVIITCRNGCNITDVDLREGLGLPAWERDTENPGHPDAIKKGCRCSRERNMRGIGTGGKVLKFEVEPECPLHRCGTEWRFWNRGKILKPHKHASAA